MEYLYLQTYLVCELQYHITVSKVKQVAMV